MSKFASFTFGCRVNQAETEEIDRQFLASGFIKDLKKPDFFIINTCAVTAKAEREVRQFINQTRKKYPKTKIVVTGCSATKWLKNHEKIPNIDLLVGNSDKITIPSLFRAQIDTQKNNTNASDKYLDSKRYLLKIQDGCNRCCSYCIVPYLRGKPQSYKIEEIVCKIKSFEKDIKELIITAINTEAYGVDNKETFNQLVKAILTDTKIARLSFGSVNPWSVNTEFLNLYRRYLPEKRWVSFFHIPLQSGSNNVLKLMKRGYTREDFEEKIYSLSKINPMAFLATDIIVGFPGEMEKNFRETYNFLEKSPLSRFHVFRYSRRPGTAAYFMSQKITEPTGVQKKKRSKVLIDLGKKKYDVFLQKHIGKTFSALFLQQMTNGYQETLLDNGISAMIKTAKDLTGEIMAVKINKLENGYLSGKIC